MYQLVPNLSLGSVPVSRPLLPRLPTSLVPMIRAVERSTISQHALENSLTSSQSRKKKAKENEQVDETQPQRKKRRIDEEVC